MNWFTKEAISTNPGFSKIDKCNKLDNLCEHVKENNDLLYIVVSENDSWGKESTGLCEKCYDENNKSEDEEEVICEDCKGEFKKKDTIEWCWYDFYAPQGDEPLIICNSCKSKETHIERVRQDTKDSNEEFGDDYDDEDDW